MSVLTDVLSSPYRRARQTTERVLDQMRRRGQTPNLVHDERLREAEFGVLDRLTRQGIREKPRSLEKERDRPHCSQGVRKFRMPRISRAAKRRRLGRMTYGGAPLAPLRTLNRVTRPC